MRFEFLALGIFPILFLLSKKRKENSSVFDDLFKANARLFNINSNLPKAIAKVESNWNPDAVGLAGELGIMQILPFTGVWLGFDALQLMIPAVNIECGCKYLRWLADTYGEKTEDMVSAYNQGQPDKYPDGKYKNQIYVDKVMTFYNLFQLGSVGGIF
jgi:soluble lytic murein transglycosylase-like protein